jgi:hypothetical protein
MGMSPKAIHETLMEQRAALRDLERQLAETREERGALGCRGGVLRDDWGSDAWVDWRAADGSIARLHEAMDMHQEASRASMAEEKARHRVRSCLDAA